MSYLLSSISNTELLENYGYEPYEYTTVARKWIELCSPWAVSAAKELGHLRQIMLQIHMDLCPDDERWL